LVRHKLAGTPGLSVNRACRLVGEQLGDHPNTLPNLVKQAWITHRRTDSFPTPTCWATACDTAVNVGYSPRCSDTRRTALAFSGRINPDLIVDG